MKLGEILVQKGTITQQQLDAAVAVQGEEKVGELLITWGWVTQDQILDALNVQAPPPPPPPPPPPLVTPGNIPQSAPDLTMDNVQASKFKIDIKTLVWLGSLLVTGMTTYFGFMSELDSRFAALENQDKDMVIEIERRMTALENTFTPIGEGVYTVAPTSTWPPSRTEYNMKDQMARNSITQIQKEIEELKSDLEKLEDK